MLPAILGLGGLAAKVAAAAVIPRIARAIRTSLGTTPPTRPPEPNSIEGTSSAPDTAQTPVKWSVSQPQPRSREFGYAGLFHHTPTGLDLATYRIYDSTQHRWLSRDPLGEGVDMNLYRYCGNDPIGCSDPDGLDGYPKRRPPKPRKKTPSPSKWCPASEWVPPPASDVLDHGGLDDNSTTMIGGATVLLRLGRLAGFAIPDSSLERGPAGQMIREALRRVARTDPSKRASELDRLLNEVQRRNTSNRRWGYSRVEQDGVTIFEGGEGTGIIVDSDGSVWRGPTEALSESHNGEYSGWRDVWKQVTP